MSALSVLVVDDEPPVRKLVGTALQAAGYQTFTAGSMTEALSAIDRDAPDLVICDVYMHGGSGFDLLAHVRQQAQHAKIPFILMTGQFEPSFVRRGIELGAIDFLVKPFGPQQLQATVQACLSNRAAAAEGDDVDLLIESLRRSAENPTVLGA